ncbi:MAG: hypothetical protein QG671_3951 [Actinomycetota bacterium]|nr:hypothetical protein [Actinomycetota bacterium]
MVVVWESAARLQQLVPDAVLVGGSAAVLHASHRLSIDHDHVIADLSDRFDLVLEALESDPEWITNRVQPGKIILGQLGGIESGVRQLIRTRPLETTVVTLPSDRQLTVPTAEETLRIKGYLIVKRNQVRDYLDVMALSNRYGLTESARVLRQIDSYYADQRQTAGLSSAGVASQLVRQLADPRPRDRTTMEELPRYKGLAPQWQDWRDVSAACRVLAVAVTEADA